MTDIFERCLELAGYGLSICFTAIAVVVCFPFVFPFMVIGWVGCRLGLVDD